jgi:hypothetical protein
VHLEWVGEGSKEPEAGVTLGVAGVKFDIEKVRSRSTEDADILHSRSLNAVVEPQAVEGGIADQLVGCRTPLLIAGSFEHWEALTAVVEALVVEGGIVDRLVGCHTLRLIAGGFEHWEGVSEDKAPLGLLECSLLPRRSHEREVVPGGVVEGNLNLERQVDDHQKVVTSADHRAPASSIGRPCERHIFHQK